MPDPTLVALGIGLPVSVVAGRGLILAVESVPRRWRKTTEWTVLAAAAAVAIVGDLLSPGPGAQGVFVFVIAVLPGTVAYLAWRTVYASALVSLLPVYFIIGGLTAGRTLHVPALALDAALPLQPAWMFVYGSLYVFVLLPLLVVRDRELFRRVLQSWVAVYLVAYAGFLVYPTAAPRPDTVPVDGFAVWCLRLNYALDVPYNCFPSLHVAHSFVSALAAYRVHRGVGIAAVAWALLIGVSTLFTKQHYVADVIGGILMAVVAHAVLVRGYSLDRISEHDQRQAPRRALVVVGVFGLVVAGFWVAYRLTGGA